MQADIATDKNQLFATRAYQTLHLLTGFIGDPAGQLQSVANSGRLETGLQTLQSALTLKIQNNCL